MVRETELQIRLRRSKEAVAYCVEKESEARRALLSAQESLRIARDKYHDLFLEEEKAEVARRTAEYSKAC